MRFAPVIAFLLLCTVVRGEWNVITHEGRRYVSLQDVADFYKMSLSDASGKKFRLTSAGSSIEGEAGGRDVRINGVKFVLCFPMVTKGGSTLLSAMDVTKIIEPVLRPQKIKNAGAVRTVILDAGHGGHDSGARGPLSVEKDMALDVVLRAKKLLIANGYLVRCTRVTDVFIPLERRASFASSQTNAIFVSVHFNKSNTGGGTGIETYCLAPRGVPSMDEESLRYSDLVQYPGHARDAENVALATCVHASLVRNLRLTDRGIKRSRFHVIKNITIPGILVEGGFMSGAPDYKLIATPEYRQRMAESILEGVNRYKSAVMGEIHFQKPSAVISATVPTPTPSPTPSPTPAPGSTTIPAPAPDKPPESGATPPPLPAAQNSATPNPMQKATPTPEAAPKNSPGSTPKPSPAKSGN